MNLRIQQAAFEQERAQAVTEHHSEPRPNLKTLVAYRVRTKNGTLVLCEPHLDKLRAREAKVKYTGDTFAVNLCDQCHPEQT
jgi:hypothetical protein